MLMSSYIRSVAGGIYVIDCLRPKQGSILLHDRGSAIDEEEILDQLPGSCRVQLVPHACQIAVLGVDQIIHGVIQIESITAAPPP